MKRKEIARKLQDEFGTITALAILAILYPERYGHNKGDIINWRIPK